MGRLLSNSLLLCVALLAFAACDNRFHRYNSVGGAWSRNDTVRFVCSPASGSAPLAAYAGVRCMPNYPYKQLLLRIEVETSPTSCAMVDTVLCDIYDDNGHWNGSTAGLLHQMEFYISTYDFSVYDTVTVRMTHAMDDEILQGISDVGLRLSDCDRRQYAGN